MGGAWLNGAESRIALERRRGAEGHKRRRMDEVGTAGVVQRGLPIVEERGARWGEREKESCLGAIN